MERLKDDLEGKSAKQTEQADSDSDKDKREVTGKKVDNTGEGICMLTLEQWLDIWRKQYFSNVKPGTVCHYESVCRLHIVPALGNTPLVKLRTPAIQKFYIDLQEKGLSPKYIKNIHGCLHKALDIAVRIDYITKNQTSACIIPRVIQKEMHPLDAGLEHHRLHDCRHTFAVNSIRAGDDIKTIQENRGHYSAAFILDRCGHVTETMRQESANRMQAFIQGMSGNEGGKS